MATWKSKTRLKALEVENAKLKCLVAEVLLANEAIQEFLDTCLGGRRQGKSLSAEERLTRKS